MEDIVELRFKAMDSHLHAIGSQNPHEKARLTRQGMHYTALADQLVASLNGVSHQVQSTAPTR